MKDEDELLNQVDELLDGIEQVAVSPFLLTRIHAELEAQRQESLPITWAWLGSALFALLFVLNVWTIQHYNNTELNASSVVEEMNLNPDNSFYH